MKTTEICAEDIPRGKLGDGVDSGTLRPADSHDLLSDTDGSRAHTNPQRIRTRHNQLRRLFPGDDVTRNDLQVGVRRLDPLDKVDLVVGIALRRVEHDHVQTGLDQQGQAVLVAGPGADGGATVQLLGLGHLAREGVVLVLEQIGTRDERNKVSVRVHNRQLAALAVPQNRVGLFERDASLGGDEVLGHDLGQGSGGVPELDVAASDDTDELAADFTRLGDGHTGKAERFFDVQDVADSVGRREAQRVGDEAVFEFLDLAHHGGLLLGGTVVVDNAETAVQREGDRHAVFGDRVHGRGEEGRVEDNLAGDPCCQYGVRV